MPTIYFTIYLYLVCHRPPSIDPLDTSPPAPAPAVCLARADEEPFAARFGRGVEQRMS